ncbi:hypothetical protein GE09DRAFT_1090798 [Coniochaeta sp. 2T2.1]|nr:hypothetical protein GE09DRAFT_1090798 [Coniochaeta sp. 2T2.1]
MNYTEMESKVREATNNEPWGASSTLMQEIANGTFNYSTLNEIMPMIYRRFTEKSAEEWRQIYKALQLLEFLIKHGSERVIDDARSHLTLLKMLRQFHFIDANGKDQGVNVRNRAKELADLLSDVERIRQERKKARANKAKYTGVEGGPGSGFSSSSRYGGFGSETGGYGGGSSSAGYGGYSGGVYGDGGGFGGQADDFRDTQRRGDQFEEYDEFDGDAPKATASPARGKRTTAAAAKAPEPPKKKEPEVDLFSFDEPAAPSIPVVSATSSSGLGALASTNDDDEFDDFQSASPPAQTVPPPRSFVSPPMAPQVTSHASNAPFAQPQPVSAPQQANLGSMVGLSSISPQPTSPPAGANYSAFSTPLTATTLSPQSTKPSGYQPTGPNYFTSVPVSAGSATSASLGASANKPAAKPSSGGDAFGALWSSAAGGIKKDKTPTAGPAMGQLAKEKSAAGIWGAAAPAPKPAGGSSSNGLDSLL